MQWARCLSAPAAGLCLNFLRWELEKFSAFGGSWIFCSLGPKPHCIYLYFHACLELYFSCYRKSMGTGWEESEEPFSRCSLSTWFGSGQKTVRACKQLLQQVICAYTGWENSLGCWGGGMAHLLLLSPFSGPRTGSCARRSNPWMLLGKSGAGGVPTVGGHVAWGDPSDLASLPLQHSLTHICCISHSNISYAPGRWPRSSPSLWERVQLQEKTFGRKLPLITCWFLWGWARPQAALPWQRDGESSSSSRSCYFSVQVHLQYGQFLQLLLECCCSLVTLEGTWRCLLILQCSFGTLKPHINSIVKTCTSA